MRIIIFLILFLPATINAQINRSATELAKENIKEYLLDKIFKGNLYQPVAYSELKRRKEKDPNIQWSIVHTFEITEAQTLPDKKNEAQKPFKFLFFLDEKMKVIKAESSYPD
jgi:hypothetical protein